MAQIDSYQNNSTVCGWLYTIMKTSYIQQYKGLIKFGKKVMDTDEEFVKVHTVKVLTRNSLKMQSVRNLVSTSKSIKHPHSKFFPKFIQD
jgi:DNA-directed RNA polymerase specialized sigma24 family protein